MPAVAVKRGEQVLFNIIGRKGQVDGIKLVFTLFWYEILKMLINTRVYKDDSGI